MDVKTIAILQFATQLVKKRGWLSEEDFASARAAGVNEAEIAEVVANTAYNIYSNYFNHAVRTEIDFPAIEALEVEAVGDSCSTGACSS